MKGPLSVCLAFALPLALAAGSARGGETACWIDRGAVVAPAAFGDIAGDFIVDLTAAKSALHDTAALSAGLAAPRPRADLRVAGERLAGFEPRVVDLDARAGGFVTNIAGVLGADAFAPFVVDLAFAPCRLRLRRHAPPDIRGGRRLALRQIAGAPAVRAAVSDGETSRSGMFALATGQAATGIADARLARRPRPGAVGAGRLRALSLAGDLFEQIQAEPSSAEPGGLGGEIGTAVWRRFRLRLDMRRGRLTLWPAP